MMGQFEYVKAHTVEDALKYLKADNACAKAGGIDLLDLMKEQILSPTRVVNLREIEELRSMKVDAKTGLHLGANVTLAELADHPTIGQKYTALSQAAGSAATPQIRNVATVAGNLCQRPRCWYFRSSDFNCLRKGGDLCYAQDGENKYHAVFDNQLCAIVHPSAIAVALMAFRARLVITNGKEKREVPIEQFFVRPEDDVKRETVLKSGELILHIIVPSPHDSTKSFYLKLREKQSFDWPLADAAAVLEMEGRRCKTASVVLGSAAPTPMRLPDVEAFLAGKVLTPALVREAIELPFRNATPLRDNKYKIQLLKAALRRTILHAAGMDPMNEEE
jgi:xanthine dehydrogenase YagS FAD-binding subunit